MDPKFEQILWHLENSRIDDQEFERVAAEIQDGNGLTSFWIPGGGDFGQDGILIDKKLNNIPLISTTSARALSNIEKNIKKLLESGWKGKKIVFATNRKLTSIKRKNINDYLAKKRIKSVGVFDSSWYAQKLLKYPHLCKSLLGITLDYPALSPLPSNPRFSNVIITIGREEEKKRIFALFEEKEDFIISGQPGSGKTHLLREIAKIGEAYFILTEDINVIASEIRQKKPKFILLEDAHSKKNLVEKLIILRRELSADFKIAIDTWPSSKEILSQTLNIPGNNVVVLEPLTRDELVELVRAEGISGPNWIIKSIVDQSRGKPGLASFLSQQFVKGFTNEVVFGNALLNRVKSDNFEDEKLIPLLSILSLGGESGIDLDKVSEITGESTLNLMIRISKLVNAGIIEENRLGALSIQPALLRYNLIKEKFLNNPNIFQSLLSLPVANVEAQKFELIQAVRVGAKVLPHDLFNLVQGIKEEETFQAFAWLGKEFCNYLLVQNPQIIQSIGEAALFYSPERALPLLFNEAAVQEYSSPNPPKAYKLIEEWMAKWSEVTRIDIFKRRECFIEQARKYLQAGGKSEVIEILSPNILGILWNNVELDPGIGRKLLMTSGIMPMAFIHKIPTLWERLVELYTMGLIPYPLFLLDAIIKMNDIRREHLGISENLFKTIENYRERFLKNLLSVTYRYDDNGFKRRLINELDRYGIFHKLKTSDDFHALYPPDDLEESNYQAREDKSKIEVGLLVDKWVNYDPVQYCKILKQLINNAKLAKLNWPDRSTYFCNELAKRVKDPKKWAISMTENQIDPRLYEPFLSRVISGRSQGWEDVVINNLDKDSPYRIVAFSQIIYSNDISDPLWFKIEESLNERDSRWLSQYFGFYEVPEKNARRLLTHNNNVVRGAFACNLWGWSDKRLKNENLRDLWEKAIIGFKERNHILKEILKIESELAIKWILANLNGSWIEYETLELMKIGISNLKFDQKKKLLNHIPLISKNKEVISAIVGKNIELYEILLSSNADEYAKTSPLEGHLSQDWEKMANLALDSNISEDSIFEGTILKNYGWSGNGVDYWKTRTNNYEQYINNSDPRITRIAERLLDYSQSKKIGAMSLQRNEEVFGRE